MASLSILVILFGLVILLGDWARTVPERIDTEDVKLIAFCVNKRGDVCLYLNGKPFPNTFIEGVRIKQPLWSIFDIYGKTLEIELIGKKPYNVVIVILL